MARFELPIPIPSPTALRRARRRRKASGGRSFAPEPPARFPQADVVHAPGRGELFYRDSGGDGPPLLLLHGWTATADLNWYPVYEPLQAAGFRVIALDHRGHGRGLRHPDPFRLTDCADDAAALLEALGLEDVLCVGYSMGGPVALLLARRHPALVRGVVLCATALHWQDPVLKVLWKGLGGLRLLLGLQPERAWRGMLRSVGYPDSPTTTWVASELSRSSARDVSEAGRELARFDARPWAASLGAPAAVVITRDDRSVPARKQHELARALRAPEFVVPGDHFAVSTHAREFASGLRKALAAVDRAATPEQRAA